MSTAHPSPPRSPSLSSAHRALHRQIASVIRGKEAVIDLLLITVIAEGHVLIEDVPGVGKTTLAKALARSIDASYGRVQFTPDLLPSDVIGVNVWLRGSDRFELHRGPIFANVVLADEINRASPKTQSALLEAMAERQVTIDNVTHPLDRPFIVLATQNPIEHVGTHPLPESQLDRFLMRLSLGYPHREAELDMLGNRDDGSGVDRLSPIVSAEVIRRMIEAAHGVHVDPALQSYLLDLVDATRTHPAVTVGASPRAALALQRAARARAATRGRDHVLPDDLKALAGPVLAHRLVIGARGRGGGATGSEIVDEILARTPIPPGSRERSRA